MVLTTHLHIFSLPTLIVSQDEGHIELELSDDPYDVQKLDVSLAPCVVTLSKVSCFSILESAVLQIRRGNRYESDNFFFISNRKHYVVTPH